MFSTQQKQHYNIAQQQPRQQRQQQQQRGRERDSTTTATGTGTRTGTTKTVNGLNENYKSVCGRGFYWYIMVFIYIGIYRIDHVISYSSRSGEIFKKKSEKSEQR